MIEDDPAGPCDGCGGPIGARGWMKPTGREHEGLPIYEFYCSRWCCDRATK